jgi:hypothetical protein
MKATPRPTAILVFILAGRDLISGDSDDAVSAWAAALSLRLGGLASRLARHAGRVSIRFPPLSARESALYLGHEDCFGQWVHVHVGFVSHKTDRSR